LITHKVVAGDTLAKLANRYGSTVAGIATANGIKNVNLIRVGQSLLIPVNSESSRGKYIPEALRAGSGDATKPGSATAAADLFEVTPPTGNAYGVPARLPSGPGELLGIDLASWLKPPKLFYLLASVAGAAYLFTKRGRR
jgi:murein DD-endopeptidase MepM/ murein hydrolase activator NlpD